MGNIGLMAGCNLSAYRPEQIENTLKYLKTIYGSQLRAISNCCGKPTLMLGELPNFKKKYQLLEDDFKYHQLDTLIVACQNCYRTINKFSNINVVSLWDILAEHMTDATNEKSGEVSIQDSCSIRDIDSIHTSVRKLISNKGYTIKESPFCKDKALCCGQGGMVGMLRPEVSQKALAMTKENMPCESVVSYCGGCHSMILSTDKKGIYLLDILFENGEKRQAPVSMVEGYKNRFRTKKIVDTFNKSQG